MSPTATRPQTRQTTPPKSSLNAAVSPAALNRPHARLSKATITELGRLWSINPQLPSASSIDAWAALRNLQAHKIHRWFTRRRPVAKRAGLILVEDEYDLPLDPPPAPPPVKISRKNEIRVKRELLSRSPSPFKQPGIKLEDDATSGSDDTLVASSPAPSKSIINHVSAYTRSSRRLRALSPIDIKALLSSPDVESCPNSPEPSSPSRSPSPAFIYPQLSLDDSFCLDDVQPQDVDDPVEKLLCCGGGSASGSGSGFVCALCRPLGNLPFSFALVSISASLVHCLFVLLCTSFICTPLHICATDSLISSFWLSDMVHLHMLLPFLFTELHTHPSHRPSFVFPVRICSSFSLVLCLSAMPPRNPNSEQKFGPAAPATTLSKNWFVTGHRSS